MKTVRIFSIVMAVVMLAVAVFPFAAASAAPRSAASTTITSPVRAFADAAMGMPLLASMSAAIPTLSLSVKSPSSPNDYKCSYLTQTPKDWTRMRSRQYFDMSWTVQNTGLRVWHANTIALKYIGGTKMQTHGNTVYLGSDVGRGGKVTMLVDMNAPKALGTYSTLWSLVSGKQNFCKLTITLTVTR